MTRDAIETRIVLDALGQGATVSQVTERLRLSPTVEPAVAACLETLRGRGLVHVDVALGPGGYRPGWGQ